ncbi:hypothetical protein MMMDOFMJ_0816 [Methylobacterium gnaphalii]|nr:hypothetical protein MMMDOFMJ_0816 [Methylobacterium gnaphalii]
MSDLSLTVSAPLSPTMEPCASTVTVLRNMMRWTGDATTTSRITATLRRNIAWLDGQAGACVPMFRSSRKPD